MIVALGGTTRPGSTTERVLRAAVDCVTRLGGESLVFGGADLVLPLYDPARAELDPAAARMVAALRRADGVLIASPGYHGAISGLVKNALDYVEELRDDRRPYLDGRAVGCISVAYGWQAAGATLQGLRTIVHSLRGWPTPLGVTVNSSEARWAPDGSLVDERVTGSLAVVASQLLEFAAAGATR